VLKAEGYAMAKAKDGQHPYQNAKIAGIIEKDSILHFID